MGEEAFDEITLAADSGTVTVRGGYGRKTICLGISEGNVPGDDPQILIALTPMQTKRLGEALGDMTAGALANAHDRVDEIKEISLQGIDRIEEITAGLRDDIETICHEIKDRD